MYNQNSDLMKQEKFMLPTMIEGDFSAEELAADELSSCQDSCRRHTPI